MCGARGRLLERGAIDFFLHPLLATVEESGEAPGERRERERGRTGERW